jgi:hypothetical protein
MSRREPIPELVRCAQELEVELASFERVAAEAAETPLDSQKNLERGARLLNDLARVEERLEGALGGLLRAINANRARQQASVDAVQSWAADLQARSAVYGEVARSFEALGPDIAAVTESLKAQGAEDAPTPEEVRVQLVAVAERAGAVRAEAEAKGFKDVARLAHAREEQLVAAAKKLGRALGA